jgi:hypothetical protein
MQAAVEELKALILRRYPGTQFRVSGDPEGSEAVHLTAIVDLEEPDEVTDLVLDRMMELLIEDNLPIYVIPVRTPERRAAMREAASREISRAMPPADDVHEKIRRWLAEEGINTEDRPEPASTFNLKVTVRTGVVMNVCQPAHAPTSVGILSSPFPEQFYSEFRGLPVSTQRSILREVRRDLLMMGMEFSGLDVPLEKVLYSTVIYLDGLMKDAFMQRLNLVHRSVVLSAQTFTHGFERAGHAVEGVSGLLRLVS